MYDYLSPLLEKEPKVIVLHIGTSDVVIKSSDTILNEILKLKLHIESKLSGANVIISCPAMRIDNPKARLTIKHIISKIKHMKVRYMLNNNISNSCLWCKGEYRSFSSHLKSKTNTVIPRHFQINYSVNQFIHI